MIETVSEKCYIVEKSKIRQNICVLQQRADYRKIYAVLKADGYGIGCREMAALCGEGGLRHFAVTDLRGAEAVMASGAAVDELLLLASADPVQIPRLVELGVSFTVASEEDARNLLPYSPKVHIKVDTGMSRRGFPAEQTRRIAALYSRYSELRFDGIYTHFSDGGDIRKTRTQFRRFLALLQELESAGINPGTRHCCSSSSAFGEDAMLLDGIRVGTALLGRIPDGPRFGLQRTGICLVPVEAVRQLSRGAAVGYGGIFHTPRETVVALCPLGTHNGFGVIGQPGRRDPLAACLDTMRWLFRRICGNGIPYGTLNGRACRVLGRICTEMTILDVTDLPCRAGDLAEFEINPMLLHDVPIRLIE